MNRLPIIFCAFCISIFNGCNIIDPVEKIPAYVKIESIVFDNPGETTKITDVWVNVDGNVIGIFELPATFPVIAEKGQELQIKPGIKKNGMAEERIAYPFYSNYIIKPEFVKGEVENIIPHFEYVTNALVVWEEDFETAIAPSFEQSTRSDTIINLNTSESYYGNYCASIILESYQDIYEGYANETFELPKNGKPVFLELDYKTNDILVVGIYARTTTQVTQQLVLYVAKSENWNKIYIDFTEAVSNNPDAIDFSFYFGIGRYENSERIEAYIDNIKLIKYNE